MRYLLTNLIFKRETAKATKDYFENYKTNAGLAKKLMERLSHSDHSFVNI